LPSYIGDLNAFQKFDFLGCSNLKKLHLFIGQLNALQKFYLYECPNLRELLSSISQLNTLQIFIYKIFPTWKHHEKNTFIYGKIKCTQSASFVKVFQLEITTFICWPIKYIPKASFVNVFQFLKTTSSISHWVHLKILICVNASTCKNYLHVYWPI